VGKPTTPSSSSSDDAWAMTMALRPTAMGDDDEMGSVVDLDATGEKASVVVVVV